MNRRVVPSASLPPGTLIDGRWELRAPIATGSSGEVVEARDTTTGQDAALKIMRTDLLHDPIAVTRFEREALATGSIDHPHVVRVLARGRDGDRPYIAMELLRGETLETRLQKGPIDRARCVAIVAQVAAAIDAAHARGVIHRDLKPDNVFLLAGDAVAVRVLDFGYARLPEQLVGELALTTPNALLGTPLYMAPEQIQATKDVDARADVWSLGVMAFELVLGRTPFDAKSVADLFVQILNAKIPRPTALDPTLPKSFDAWCAKALARPREERYPTATALAEGFARALKPPSRTVGVVVGSVLLLAVALALAIARMR